MTGPWVAAFVALWVLVIALGLLVLGTLRRLLPLIERSEEVISSAAKRLAIGGLPRGTTTPTFMAEQVNGATFTELDLRGSSSVVLFLGSGCKACAQLVDDLEKDRAPDLGVRLVVVSGDRTEAQMLASSEEATVLVDEQQVLARIFQSAVAPHAFMIDEHGVVLASGVPSDWEDLRHLRSTTEGGDRRSDIAAAVVRS
jgi:peroxiredoxin